MKTLALLAALIAASCAPVEDSNPLDALTIPNDRSPADGRFGKFGNERP